MRTNRFCLAALPTWMVLILWTVGIVLSAVPEPGVAVDRASFRQQVAFESIDTMPVLAAQDWRQSASVRVETAPGHSKNNDLKKLHAAFADPAFILAAPTSLHTRRGSVQPVPESWYGSSFSPRSPPSAA